MTGGVSVRDVADLACARLLGARIRGFLDSSQEERLRLFRLYLQLTVTRVSPLVLDLAAHAGSDFESLVADLVPPRSWPELLVVRGAGDVGRFADATDGLPRMRLTPSVLNPSREPTRPGSKGGASGTSLLVSAGMMDARLTISGGVIRTRGALIDISLPLGLPDTVRAALPGRPIDVLLSHPLLDGRGYVVERVRSATFPGDVVTVRAGTLPACLPWGALVADELGSNT